MPKPGPSSTRASTASSQGVIRKHQWPFWSRALFYAFGGRFGDHRDWPVVDAWADQIAPALRSMHAATLA